VKLSMKKHHLVLLPGMDGTGKLFAPLLNALPGHFDPVVVRFPPEDKLNYQQLFPLIRNAIPWGEPYSIIAESFSGPLALLFAQKQRTDIKSIILAATFIKNPAPGWLTPMASFFSPLVFKARPHPGILRKFALGNDAPPALLDLVQSTMASLDPGVMQHRLKMVFQTDATNALKEFDRPILYLRATQDRIVWSNAMDEIKAIKPSVQTVDIETAHLLLQTRPVEAVKSISKFLESLQ